MSRNWVGGVPFRDERINQVDGSVLAVPDPPLTVLSPLLARCS